MMLAQFLVRYPTGSLISELLTIYQGKFVVRVSAQVEGVLRATGMAVSDSLELAEDQARSRALMVLGIELTQKAGQGLGDGEPPHKVGSSTGGPPAQDWLLNGENLPYGGKPSKSAVSPHATTLGTSAGNWLLDEGGLPTELAPQGEGDGEGPPDASSPALFSWDQVDAPVENFGNVTPLVPRNYSEEITETPEQNAEAKMEASEPIDLSDLIARTSVELKRLGWGTQQGREYLKQTYNKRSRQELTDQEMLEFLHYLESQPSQSAPFA